MHHAIAVRVVPVAHLPIPQVPSLQCQRTCISFTADILQIHCCVRTLACVKLLAMLTLDEDMLQSNMLQPNVLQSYTLQPNRLQSNMLQSNMLQSKLLEWVCIASHAHKGL